MNAEIALLACGMHKNQIDKGTVLIQIDQRMKSKVLATHCYQK